MGKPLLTDEILESEKQYSDQSSQFGHYRPNQDISMDDALFDPYLEEDYQDMKRDKRSESRSNLL